MTRKPKPPEHLDEQARREVGEGACRSSTAAATSTRVRSTPGALLSRRGQGGRPPRPR